jgi:hypothetical protein
MWVREMPPVPLAEHEQIVGQMLEHKRELEDKLSQIMKVLNDK